MPICKTCQNEVEELVKRTTKCKTCNSEYQKQWRKNNLTKEKSHQYHLNYYSQDKKRKEHLLRMKLWRKEQDPEYLRSQVKSWYEKNKETRAEYWKEFYLKHPEKKIMRTVRTRLNNALNYYNKTKKQSTLEFLGCSIEDYIIYLEQKFTNKMNWENYGNYWEIDHIKPLVKGGSFHYTNTQPLTITENRKKGGR